MRKIDSRYYLGKQKAPLTNHSYQFTNKQEEKLPFYFERSLGLLRAVWEQPNLGGASFQSVGKGLKYENQKLCEF